MPEVTLRDGLPAALPPGGLEAFSCLQTPDERLLLLRGKADLGRADKKRLEKGDRLGLSVVDPRRLPPCVQTSQVGEAESGQDVCVDVESVSGCLLGRGSKYYVVADGIGGRSGDFELNVAFRFGGTPYDVCERGIKLFAKEILPVLKSWGSVKAAAAE